MNSEGSWSLWITTIKLPFNFPLRRIMEAIVATSPCWPPQCFLILVAILEAHVPGSSNGVWLNMLSKKPSFPSSTQIHHILTHKPDLSMFLHLQHLTRTCHSRHPRFLCWVFGRESPLWKKMEMKTLCILLAPKWPLIVTHRSWSLSGPAPSSTVWQDSEVCVYPAE